MTSGCGWRLRWLVGVETDVARLRGALRSAGAGDARHLRAMLAELREARIQLREAATLQADVHAVSEITGAVGAEAQALALRLRGMPWREVLAGLGGDTMAAVGRGWRCLLTTLVPESLSVGHQTREVGPTPRSEVQPGRPGASASPLERWIGRARDAERTLRLLDVFRRAGLVPPGTGTEVVYRHARPATASCYMLVHVGPPVAALWNRLRTCGLRLLGPAPAIV